MNWSPYVACLWPGGAALWHKGDFWGVAWALPFAAVLNFCLIATWVWPELVEAGWVHVAWLAAWGAWLIGAGVSAWRMGDYLPGRPDPTADELFVFAQEQYLHGDWLQAEATLTVLLQASPDDAEARLLLATMFRRTHKLPAAREELTRLGALDSAARWSMEIERELAAIAELEEEQNALAAPEPAAPEPTEKQEAAPTKKSAAPQSTKSTAGLRVVAAEEDNAAGGSTGSAGESAESARPSRRAA